MVLLKESIIFVISVWNKIWSYFNHSMRLTLKAGNCKIPKNVYISYLALTLDHFRVDSCRSVLKWVVWPQRFLNVFLLMWYHMYNLKKVKNIYGTVLLSIKLKAQCCSFTKSNTSPWVSFTFSKSYKFYQIAQAISYDHKSW